MNFEIEPLDNLSVTVAEKQTWARRMIRWYPDLSDGSISEMLEIEGIPCSEKFISKVRQQASFGHYW